MAFVLLALSKVSFSKTLVRQGQSTKEEYPIHRLLPVFAGRAHGRPELRGCPAVQDVLSGELSPFPVKVTPFYTFVFTMLFVLCRQAFSYGGTLSHNVEDSKVETMKPVRTREIRVHFTADTSSSMQWSFKPLQTEIRVMVFSLLKKFFFVYSKVYFLWTMEVINSKLNYLPLII